MKNILTILLLSITVFSYTQTPCVGGFADIYPCNNMDLMSFMPVADFDSGAGNDSWGWTDPDTGKEYALFCNRSNLAFVDITDPVNPIYIGKMNRTPGTDPNTWRDVKVYNNYAFVVSEASGHGMQVFDLTRLRDVSAPPVVFPQDAINDSFGSAHNIVINEDTGYAYIVGTTSFNGGPIFINIQDPENPVNEGGYSVEGYSHDAQVITYNGEDTEHVGKELYIGANESSVVIIDVTNKTSPIKLSEIFYSNTAYTHQIWIDENHKYLYCNDEQDESFFGFNTRNIVFDLSDLDNPQLHHQYFGTTTAIDHNNYVVGNELYLANYRAGVRVIDISDIDNNNMSEDRFFDTFPNDNSANFDGAWSVYPFFESGNIVISDDIGLFIVRASDLPLTTDENELLTTNLYPNPAENIVHISTTKNIEKIEVSNILGEKVITINENFSDTKNYELDITTLNTGIYFIRVNNFKASKFIKK
ncbi:MAG: choice-of-anchor B family protein [Flavobacteriaceae bacterium]|nr:choice-of-anchor B family protein [Flavobacteriaceae bacterium]